MVELVWMRPGDEERVAGASSLFDEPVRTEWAADFLARPNHHLAIAFVEGVPAGFVSGVEIAHPDKGTEMLLYELGVDEAHRRRGIATALVTALRDRAGSLGCRGVWVPFDPDDAPAAATYRSLRPDEIERAAIAWWAVPPGDA